MTVVVHAVSRAIWDAELLKRWRSVPTAIIADISGGVGLIDPAIRPLRPSGRQPRLFGPAVTAQCAPPDFGAVLHALDGVQAGDVFVIAADARADHAMIGGILGGFLHRRGAAGIVCDGAIRDVAELANFRLSVFVRHVTPRGPAGVSDGVVNGNVSIGGRSIAPGDLIIGDDDGLASLSLAEAESWIEKAEAKLALEAEWQRRLASDETIAQVFGLKA
jgi:4-hydroxy-4-methyl-2-oxoglutarate aldolase